MVKKSLPKTFKGKSTKLGYGGRSAMLKAALQKKGLPPSEIGGIIGKRARAMKAAPGMKNYHGKRGK
jgi:hypothetical protein